MGRRFRSLDAFDKVESAAKIKTNSGGFVTIISILVIVFLLVAEWSNYRRIVVHPELVVDTGRGERLTINLNITFPMIPCSMLSLDLMDVAGEQQHNIEHDVTKSRISAEGVVLNIDKLALGHSRYPEIQHAAGFCGTCYGARPDGECCNTCEDVRNAYGGKGWSIGDLDAISQCKEEHYKEQLEEQSHEGCNIAGRLSVNKGNFHLAPGKSFQSGPGQSHLHDIQSFLMDQGKHSFSHTINHLSFGPEIDGRRQSNPLDHVIKRTEEAAYSYTYFVKIVSTEYHRIGVASSTASHTYSVTAHERSINGGVDKENPTHVNARGGIPGVYFAYDISPLKLIEKEQHGRFSSFLVGAMSSIGGVLSVAALLDRGIYEAAKTMKAD